MKLYSTLLISLIFLAGLFVLAVPQDSFAAVPAVNRAQERLKKVGEGTGLGTQEDDTKIYGRVAQIINIVLGLTGIVATIYFIIGGIKWLRAGGNEQTVTEAKGTIKTAITGLVVVLASYIIVNFLVARIIQAVA